MRNSFWWPFIALSGPSVDPVRHAPVQSLVTMCVPRARLAVGIAVILPIVCVLLENPQLLLGSGHLFPHVHNLTDSQLESYERNGYILLPGIVPPAMIARVLEELHGIQADAERAADADLSKSSVAWDSESSGADSTQCTFSFAMDAHGKLEKPPTIHKAQGIGLKSRTVLELVRYPPIAQTAASLVRRGLRTSDSSAIASVERSEVDAFGTKYFPVQAGSPGSVSWHDDNYYFGTTRSDTISCVVYLRTIDVKSGCLRVLPGSHRDSTVGSARAHLYQPSLQQVGEYISEETILSTLAVGPDGKQRAPLDLAVTSGSVVLFDANLLHSANANLRDGGLPASERVAFHFIPGDLDTGFRGTSFARGAFADRHLAVRLDGTFPAA